MRKPPESDLFAHMAQAGAARAAFLLFCALALGAAVFHSKGAALAFAIGAAAFHMARPAPSEALDKATGRRP